MPELKRKYCFANMLELLRSLVVSLSILFTPTSKHPYSLLCILSNYFYYAGKLVAKGSKFPLERISLRFKAKLEKSSIMHGFITKQKNTF